MTIYRYEPIDFAIRRDQDQDALAYLKMFYTPRAGQTDKEAVFT